MTNKDISKNFSKYKLKKSKESMKELCLPKHFALQPQQKFLRDYFGSRYSNNGLLIYHKIGAGKTCTAVAIAEKLKKRMNVVVVVPAALIGNFRDELRSKCADNEYISDSQRELLKNLTPKNKLFKKIMDESNNKINKFYKIYSYHKFIELCEKNKIKLRNTLLVIDEVQNMVSESGNFYKNLKNIIDKSDDKTKIVLLSATPMFDKPLELALTLNLLKLKKEIEIGNEFNNKYLKRHRIKNEIHYKLDNKEELQEFMKGYISYYRGANPNAFPKQIFKTVNCKMEPFQYKSYLTSLSTEEYMKGSFRDADILDLPNNFLLGPRIISNISFPNKGIGAKGFTSFKGSCLKTTNMKKYSKKFYKIYNKIKKSSGPIFIYSNFKDYGGIKSMITFLEHHGYKNYKVNGEGNKRFALWTGDERLSMKEEIKFTFNKKENFNGSKIKILLGTPSIKEGVSLLRVEQVHILEPYWNMSRLLQIIGRAIRFCSHKDLPSSKRQVEVFLYLATYPGVETVDQKIWSMAKRKHILIEQFETVMKEVAIDCKLFYNKNVYKDDKPIKCIN
jgi:superfamily II DNA or RNA helicase